DLRASAPQALLDFAHLLHGVDLEREVVEAWTVGRESPAALLPEREDQSVTLTQEHEELVRFLGFERSLEAEYLLVELLRPLDVADVEADVAGLQRGDRSGRPRGGGGGGGHGHIHYQVRKG